MPASFIALSWNAADASRQEAVLGLTRAMASAMGWRQAADETGLRLWVREESPSPARRLGASRGVWLAGRLFGGRAPEGRAERAPAIQAREWADGAWGAYVALLPDPRGGPWWALRDPSGALEAFTWTRCGVGVLSDELEDVPHALMPERIDLDWDAVGDLLARPVSAWGRCALAPIQSIAPGEARPVGGERPGTFVWRPDQAVRREPPDEPARRLVEVVADACERMAASCGRILVETSGGLDSSIVAACVGRSPARARVASAINQFAPQAESDERAWARAACAAAGLPLLEVEKPEAQIALEDFTALAGGARPAVSGLDAVRDRTFLRLAAEFGADAMMTGQGGDGVFFQMPTALVAADLLRARGLKAFADGRVLELCRWLRRSVWSVWLEALRAPRRPAMDAAHLLGPQARPASGPAHPWLSGLERLPPGKQVQVEYLAFCQSKHGPSLRARRLAILHPLLSQPVMELCLSIRSWELVRGGRDRGLAREAFAHMIPAEVAERRSKGELSTLYTRRMAASLETLRPLLLDGALVDAGMLDRAAVDAALTPEGLIWRGDGLRLLHAAAVEVWVRRWKAWRADGQARAA